MDVKIPWSQSVGQTEGYGGKDFEVGTRTKHPVAGVRSIVRTLGRSGPAAEPRLSNGTIYNDLK